VIDNANGTYTATITNSTVETVTVSAAFGGSNVDDTVDGGYTAYKDYIIYSNTGWVAVNNVVIVGVTTLKSADSYGVADGTSASTITMQARDANGNNLTTGGLTVTMSATGSATLSAVSDNADGTYTAGAVSNSSCVSTISVIDHC
jgi:hypothetical protein